MKLRITESQYERLKSVVKENVNNRYNREVIIRFNYRGLPYKGGNVDEIVSIKTRVNFNIDLELKSWGVSSAYISGIKGPNEVETEVHFYPEGQEESISERIKILLNWDDLKTEETKGSGLVSIGDYLDVELVLNESGVFVSNGLSMNIYVL